jgi:uncharacterized membrane protein YcaP (DUF421 family)
MFNLSVPWWELVIRAIVVYVILLTLLRLTGKRQVGQLSPFDLVLLLILSNAVQNSMNAGDNSLLGGIISAGVLVGLNYVIGVVTFRSRKLENLIEGQPQVLIFNGVLFTQVMARAQLPRHDLDSALRQHGCDRHEEVKLAVLEDNGAISVIPFKEGEKSKDIAPPAA